MSARPARPKCPGHVRHWFTNYGCVGDYVEKCVRCGAPNPKVKKAKA